MDDTSLNILFYCVWGVGCVCGGGGCRRLAEIIVGFKERRLSIPT